MARHPAVAECAVIGVADAMKGELPVGFVVLKAGNRPPAEIEKEAVSWYATHRPGRGVEDGDDVTRLPKTRSGKILRGTMRAIADGEP